MRHLILIPTLLSMFILGCNRTFFVNKDDVIHRKKGYLFITQNQVEFIPIKIDTSLTLKGNLEKYKIEKGFYIYRIDFKTLDYLKNYGITPDKTIGKLVPVVLEYREIKDKNLQIRKRERVFTKQSFFVEGKRYIYEVNHPDIYYLNAIPLKKSFRILDE